MKNNLTEQSLRGAQWRFSSVAIKISLQFVVGIILARLLSPEDFGVVAYAMVFVGFFSIFSDIGIIPALIQRKEINEYHIRVGFFLSILMGFFLSFLIYMLSFILANELIAKIFRVLALFPIISGFGMVSRALLLRNLNFYKLFLVDILSFGVGYAGFSIPFALLGYGVWSLVFGSLIQCLIQSVLLNCFSHHSVIPGLRKMEAKQLLNFGIGISLARISNYCALNTDYFVIGNKLSAGALGLYTRAYQLITLPSANISSILTSVLFPVYSKIQDDRQRLQRGYLLAVTLASFIIIPVMATISVASPEIIVGLFGVRWSGSIIPLRILSMAGFFSAIYTLGDALARAKAKVYQQFFRHAIFAIVVFIGSLIGCSWGIIGVCVAVSFATLLMYLMMAQLSLKIVGATWIQFFHAQRYGAIVGLLVIFFGNIIVGFMRNLDFGNIASLCILIVLFAGLCLACLICLPRNITSEVVDFIVVHGESRLPLWLIKLLNR